MEQRSSIAFVELMESHVWMLCVALSPGSVQGSPRSASVGAGESSPQGSGRRRDVHQLKRGLTRPRRATLESIRAPLEFAGVEFIDENGGGPGVRLRKRQLKKG